MYIKLNRVASGRALSLPVPLPRPVCWYDYDNKSKYSLRHAVTIDVTSLTTRSWQRLTNQSTPQQLCHPSVTHRPLGPRRRCDLAHVDAVADDDGALYAGSARSRVPCLIP